MSHGSKILKLAGAVMIILVVGFCISDLLYFRRAQKNYEKDIELLKKSSIHGKITSIQNIGRGSYDVVIADSLGNYLFPSLSFAKFKNDNGIIIGDSVSKPTNSLQASFFKTTSATRSFVGIFEIPED